VAVIIVQIGQAGVAVNATDGKATEGKATEGKATDE
jgi:hypothetical protein